MPGTKLVIGPWPLGLNQQDDQELLNDKSLASVVNFDVDVDGSLQGRRACRKASIPPETRVGAKGYTALGSVALVDDKFAIFEQVEAEGVPSRFIYTKNPKEAWTLAAFQGAGGNGRYSSVTQYNNFIYFVPFEATIVATGFRVPTLTSAATTVPAMPAGFQSFIVKDRLFIVGSTRVYYSKATDPTIWAAPDGGFFDVSPGDGQVISKAIFLNNTIYFFKRTGTWAFTYTDNPSLDGTLRQISYDMGAYDAVVYNNEIYLIDGRSVHHFINGYFQDMGKLLNFVETDNLESSLAFTPNLNVIDRTLIVGPTGTGRYYAMNFDNNAWCEYTFQPNVRPDSVGVQARDTAGSYTCFSNPGLISFIQHSRAINRVVDTDEAGVNKAPEYSFLTKHHTFNDKSVWKRLYWWSFNGEAALNAQVSSPLLRINKSAVILASEKVQQKVVALSARFRTLAVGFFTASQTVDSETLQVAPSYTSITLYISERSPVDQ